MQEACQHIGGGNATDSHSHRARSPSRKPQVLSKTFIFNEPYKLS